MHHVLPLGLARHPEIPLELLELREDVAVEGLMDEAREKHARLAAQLEDTIRNVGFWIVTGHGIPDEEVKRMLAIGNAFFKLPMEEKVKVPIDLGNDLNWGYREPTRALGDSGWKESVETVCITHHGRKTH